MTFLIPFHDAGLLREYIANHYGKYLAYGGSYKPYTRAIKLCQILAKKAGQELDDVIEDVKNDYLQMEEDY